MRLPLLSHISVKEKRVLVRVSFDVPTDRKGDVLDSFRLKRSLPTLRWLIRHGSRTILLGHRGEPHGKRSLALSLRPVARAMTRLLGHPVDFTARPAARLESASRKLQPGQVLLLENLRFDVREERGNRAFGQELAALGDLYVNDDFATSHRAHSSFVVLPKLLPHAAGFNVHEEVHMLERLMQRIERPYFIVLGGAKVRDKLGAVRNLLRRVDGILVGGASACTLLRAKGYEVGRSLVDPTVTADDLHALAKSNKVHLPTDVVAASSKTSRKTVAISVDHFPKRLATFDLGPATVRAYGHYLKTAKTVFWAGSIGLTERRAFCAGTKHLVAHLSPRRTFGVAGGGDTIHALDDLGLTRHFSFLSTGGGATLTFLAGEPLPGIEALRV